MRAQTIRTAVAPDRVLVDVERVDRSWGQSDTLFGMGSGSELSLRGNTLGLECWCIGHTPSACGGGPIVSAAQTFE